ncbi:heme-binding protein [Halocatena pleomorpha]|uniref:Heme-binding protein n=1 Tax=Halocatena pleomorpha TaxID=1785090 RepID=A0A3P3RFH0_9EURY|nr:heme-binding protein [Halocatena pleomorpha]
MPEAPQTDEGWYALHDFRTVDWDAWRDATKRERDRAIESGIDYLQAHEALSDTDEEAGGSAVFTVLGHTADLLILHLRPTTAQLDTAERTFEQTAFARFTEQTASYVSVTEVSGYMSQEYFEGETVEDSGMARYIRSRIEPEIPDAEHVCFYPMDKRRGEQDNWYDLPFEERADLMSNHGEIGREYAGKVTQIITGSIGFDDYEWGVTLFADDPTEIKHLLYEMRFDPSSSRYAEFGSFYFGRRFGPSDLDAVLAGDPVDWDGRAEDDSAASELSARLDRLGVTLDAPADTEPHAVLVSCDSSVEELTNAVNDLRGNFEHYDSHIETFVHDGDEPTVISTWTTARAADTAAGFLDDLPGATETLTGSTGTGDDDSGGNHGQQASTSSDLRSELASLDIYAGQPHGEDVHAIVLYSTAPVDELEHAVGDLSDGFDRYDTHVDTSVYQAHDQERSAVVSLWDTESGAETAGGYLADLPEIVARPGDETDGFGTMGMFYTVKPEHREEFVSAFEEVNDVLAGMDGHRETDLMINTAAENDMFIASQWRSKEDAMAFFRSDEFRETVEWGRDILTDRPRHVFLA